MALVGGNHNRSVSALASERGGTALSALLHLATAALLYAVPALAPMDEEPLAMMVELATESAAPPPAAEPPRPAPAPTAMISPRPPAVRPTAAPRPTPVPAAIAPATGGEAPASPPAAAAPAAASVPADPPAPAPAAAVRPPIQYGEYVGRLHQRIAQRRIYPPQSIRRREEGDVRLRILVATDGRLLHIHNLAEASALLTQAARSAVESSAPFDPPPPASASDTQIAFDVTVAFRLH